MLRGLRSAARRRDAFVHACMGVPTLDRDNMLFIVFYPRLRGCSGRTFMELEHISFLPRERGVTEGLYVTKRGA